MGATTIQDTVDEVTRLWPVSLAGHRIAARAANDTEGRPLVEIIDEAMGDHDLNPADLDLRVEVLSVALLVAVAEAGT